MHMIIKVKQKCVSMIYLMKQYFHNKICSRDFRWVWPFVVDILKCRKVVYNSHVYTLYTNHYALYDTCTWSDHSACKIAVYKILIKVVYKPHRQFISLMFNIVLYSQWSWYKLIKIPKQHFSSTSAQHFWQSNPSKQNRTKE